MPLSGAMNITSITRSTNNKMIGGVASGLSQKYGWDLKAVRILMVASVLLPGPQVLLYLAAWAFIPADTQAAFVPNHSL
jgi:phage shock protein C